MAPVFYHFAGEAADHEDPGRYMLGEDLLVAPVLHPNLREMSVALPNGTDWVHAWTGEPHAGGTKPLVACPWGQCPIFVRKDAARQFATAFPALATKS